MSRPTPSHDDPMRYITRLKTCDSWRVRLKRNRISREQNFGFARFGGESVALKAAQAWRDEMERELGPPQPESGFFKKELYQPKSSNCPVGVFRTVVTVRRKSGTYQHVRYGVNYRTADGKLRAWQINAGNPKTITKAKDDYARKSAIAFRKEWEHCTENALPFDPGKYKNWRTKKMFPFKP